MSQEEGVGKKFFVPRLSPLAPPNPEVRSGRAPVAPAEVNRPSSHPLSEPPRDSWEDMTPSSVPSAPLDPEERRSLIEEIKSLEHRLEEEAVQRRMDQVLSASRAADARLSDEVLQDSVVHTTPHIELDRASFQGHER